MDKFRFEIPTKEREQDAIDFINEFYEYNSNIKWYRWITEILRQL